MDAKTLAISVANGVVLLPMDFYLGIERTFQDLSLSDGGRNIQRRNFGDDERMYRALNKLFRNRAVLRQIAEMIIKDSLSYLPDTAIKKNHRQTNRNSNLIGFKTVSAAGYFRLFWFKGR